MRIIINLMLSVLIPFIAYIIAAHLGVKPKRYRLIAALIALSYPAVIANSTMDFGESFGFIFPLVVAFIMLFTMNLKQDGKNLRLRRLLSVLLGVVLAAGIDVYVRMVMVSVAAFFAILFARFFRKKRIFCLIPFFVSLICTTAVVLILGNVEIMLPTVEGASAVTYGNTARDLTNLICGHLFYFTVSTWGAGILGLCILIKRFRENGSSAFISMFAFLLLFFNMAVSVISKYGTDFEQSQEILIYGKYMDGVIPLILVSVFCYVYNSFENATSQKSQNDSEPQLELRMLLTSIIVLGLIFTAFFISPAEIIVKTEKLDVSAVPGLYPLRIGAGIDSLITIDTLFLSVSAVFSLMALFIVFISCAGRYRYRIIAWSVATIALYSLIYTSVLYVPFIMRST
ncbi:MAG: hypothetical protein FWF94_02120 [Oscillospiraceae bacterium]|nr:hypothetical protein [Oscillospiraceae bacterium]